MRKMLIAATLALVIGGTATYAWALPSEMSANGHGALTVLNDSGREVNRQFSLSARRDLDGTVTGHAVLINPAFAGESGHGPYRLHVDITCMHVVGNIAVFGGTVRHTNDPGLVDAVFFSVQDNGEPGEGVDRISRVFFWDDDPTTTGDPQACLLTGPLDFPLEPIDKGNIQVRPTGL
jgi:hypothetical protein